MFDIIYYTVSVYNTEYLHGTRTLNTHEQVNFSNTHFKTVSKNTYIRVIRYT